MASNATFTIILCKPKLFLPLATNCLACPHEFIKRQLPY